MHDLCFWLRVVKYVVFFWGTACQRGCVGVCMRGESVKGMPYLGQTGTQRSHGLTVAFHTSRRLFLPSALPLCLCVCLHIALFFLCRSFTNCRSLPSWWSLMYITSHHLQSSSSFHQKYLKVSKRQQHISPQSHRSSISTVSGLKTPPISISSLTNGVISGMKGKVATCVGRLVATGKKKKERNFLMACWYI